MTDIWRGRLVRLRGLEPEDWETFFTWNLDSDTARMLDHAWFPTSATRARRWAEETALRSVEDDTFFFAIEEHGHIMAITPMGFYCANCKL